MPIKVLVESVVADDRRKRGLRDRVCEDRAELATNRSVCSSLAWRDLGYTNVGSRGGGISSGIMTPLIKAQKNPISLIWMIKLSGSTPVDTVHFVLIKGRTCSSPAHN